MTRQVPELTKLKQRTASNPEVSAWVSAHAGSGKTHVLTQRVVRLLLDGAKPSRLICLTFTKAAAANMSERVFRTLARWTLMPDDVLRAEIAATGATPPADLDIARRLFAVAVETPGGLKIQTIHAFCERVLHLFPFEANAPADFRVVEDLERLELMQLARQRTLEAASADARLGEALARVSEETWDGGFEKILDAAFARRDLLRDETALIARLPDALGLKPGESEAEIQRRIVHDGIPCAEWATIADTIAAGSSKDVQAAGRLRNAILHAPHVACIEHYFSVFFTKDGDLRQSVTTGAIEKIAPGLPDRLMREGERIAALHDKLKAARALTRSSDLVALAADCLRRYSQIKQARALLDFDDLIDRTRRLLMREGASSWVLYKLDGGVDHILVDEAQDTSEAQWDILRALSAEFTAGASARPQGRTFFAVGDEKQSIFSFQGAAPEAFDRMKQAFRRATQESQRLFEDVELDLSFRSARLVLESVDAVFASPFANRGLTATPDRPPKHFPLKHDMAGLIEIWPTIEPAETVSSESWVLPLDLPRETDPPVELARRIADKIRDMIAEGSAERLTGPAPGTLRPITPGDVMILVRRRGPFFDAMVRALKEAGVPVAGADRLDVGQHIAVMDMIAAARVALAPQDDLTLATVLKSPLIGLDDDDLMILAPGRPGGLWEALRQSSLDRHRAAAARISIWRRRARDAKPFDFFSHLLGPEGGRKAFLERIGPEASDALDELMALALTHERQEAASLVAFAHALETIDLTVKRDMEAAGALVRVMTAHAAKGLEAPIVFLPDTCAAPSATHDPKLFEIATAAGPTLVWSAKKTDDPPAVARRRDILRAAADDEYRRLLYVAMTRAEERLYICGYRGAHKPPDHCWRNLIELALRPLCDELPDPSDPDRMLLRYGAPLTGAAAPLAHGAVEEVEPDWLRRPAPAEPAPAPPLRPSSALAGADAPDRDDAFSRDSAPGALAHGLVVHALLQGLPRIDAARRHEVALRYLRAQASSAATETRDAIARDAIGVIEAPACTVLFGPQSRAEVAIAAKIARPGKTAIDIVGRIDRLAEVGDEIWIADFKTGARPAATPQAYVAQLALYREAVCLVYPARKVRTFILWTADAALEELGAVALGAALLTIP